MIASSVFGGGGGKSELSRARCHVTRGPARDGKCHRKHTALSVVEG